MSNITQFRNGRGGQGKGPSTHAEASPARPEYLAASYLQHTCGCTRFELLSTGHVVCAWCGVALECARLELLVELPSVPVAAVTTAAPDEHDPLQ